MEVRVQSVNFTADQKLIDFTEKKLSKLQQYYEGTISADVFFKVENVTDGINKTAEVKLAIPGNDLVGKKTCGTFEEAVDLCGGILARQLRKRKEKIKGY
jgi:putative sigma-54 modulation protein